MSLTKQERNALQAERLRRVREQNDARMRRNAERDAAYRSGQRHPDIAFFNLVSPDFVRQIVADAGALFAQEMAMLATKQLKPFHAVMDRAAAAIWDRMMRHGYSAEGAEASVREDMLRDEIVFDFVIPEMRVGRRVARQELIFEAKR